MPTSHYIHCIALCAGQQLTEEIEKALGTVVSSEKTEEYFEQEITLNVQNQQQVIQKGDPLYVDPTIPSW